jgi:hypothetical protein
VANVTDAVAAGDGITVVGDATTVARAAVGVSGVAVASLEARAAVVGVGLIVVTVAAGVSVGVGAAAGWVVQPVSNAKAMTMPSSRVTVRLHQ